MLDSKIRLAARLLVVAGVASRAGFVIGPTPAPAAACTTANAGATAVSGSVTWTCACSGASPAAPMPTPAVVKAPEVIFSASRDGAASTTLSAVSTLHGRVENASGNARGCMEVVGKNVGYCSSPANWTKLPNADWSYDAATRKWRSTIAPGTFPGGQYRMFFEDADTKLTSKMVELQLTAPSCQWTSGFVVGPTPQPSAACTAASAGSTAISNGATFTCSCR